MITYTSLYVLDGDSNDANGAIVLHWVAVDEHNGIRTHVTTYDGRPKVVQTYAMGHNLQMKLRKYTKVDDYMEIPECFRKLEETHNEDRVRTPCG